MAIPASPTCSTRRQRSRSATSRPCSSRASRPSTATSPTLYITGNPGQTAPVTRQLERDMASLTTLNPITGATDNLMAAMAGVTQMKLLHMVTADPARTPTFTYFGNENYFIFSSGQTKSCTQTPAFVVEQPRFARNHRGFQKDHNRTFLPPDSPRPVP